MPHFDRTEVIQHVTFHLADSLPKNVLAELDAELRALPPEQQDAERRKRIETWMDAGYGSCLLGDTNVAAIVQDSLLHFDGQRYRILAWVIMPNHVHVLVQPMNGSTIAKIVASWKSFTAKRIMEDSGHANLRVGPMWHREYWVDLSETSATFKRQSTTSIRIP